MTCANATKTVASLGALGALVVSVLLVAAPGLYAQDSNDETETPSASSSTTERTPGEVSNVVDEISQQMYSPYCELKSLSMCPSGGAAEVRRFIQQQARQGVPVDVIKERVRQKYREQYLDTYGEDFRWKEPPAQDNYPLMAIVAAGLVLCVVAVWLLVRASGTEERDEGPSDDEWSEEDEIYLDEIRSQYQD